jgi:hypothetical protein
MDPFLILLIASIAMFIYSIYKATADSRRRKREWAAYYASPRPRRRQAR